MTTYNRTTLKTFFETGDVPTGTDYANLIDSCANIVETSAQSFAGPIITTELITPRVSAANVVTNSMNITGNDNAFMIAAIISAGGTIQASANTVDWPISQVKGVVDGVSTGILLKSNKKGMVQYIYNDAASANLYPCVHGTINALAADAPFSMAASTLYTVVHIGNSAAAVR